MKRVLITGFGKFGNNLSNPTEQMLSSFSLDGVELLCKILPVSFENLERETQNLISKFRPDYIIHTGLAGIRDKITVEKVAINYINARIADNEGRQPTNTVIKKNGSDGLFSSIDVVSLTSLLQKEGHNVDISYSAGTYVCNFLMYTTLFNLKNSNVGVTFIHFPPLEKGYTIADFQKFLKDFVSLLLDGKKTVANLEKLGRED